MVLVVQEVLVMTVVQEVLDQLEVIMELQDQVQVVLLDTQ